MKYRYGIIVSGLLLAALGAALAFLPLTVAPDGPASTPTTPLRATGHPVLLVVDAASIRQSSPDAAWPDLEWQNILGQAFGGCDLTSMERLVQDSAQRELIVVPRRSAASLDSDQLSLLGSRVRDGSTVLLEAPDSVTCRTLGLELGAVERRGQLPWPKPFIVTGETTPVLRPQPVPIEWSRFRYAPSTAPGVATPEVRLSLDGRPLGWVQREGAGGWAALAMDLGDLALRVRQGAAGSALAGTDEAWLDAWIEGVAGAFWSDRPVARLSTARFGADGWLLVGVGERAEDLPDWVTVFADASTNLAIADADGLTGWASLPTDWSVVPTALRSRGALGLTRSLVSPAVQRERSAPVARAFRSTSAAGDAPLLFPLIAGAGITVDASLTPLAGSSGWQFGSGVPFAPVTGSGTVIGLHRVPVLADARSDSLDLRRIDRWMRRNAVDGASPIQLMPAPGASATAIEGVVRLAERRSHDRIRVADLVSWWQRRSQVQLLTRVDGEDLVIHVRGVSGSSGMAALVPVRWGDRSLTGWEADWGMPASRRTQRFDRGYRLVALDPEAEGGELRLRYR